MAHIVHARIAASAIASTVYGWPPIEPDSSLLEHVSHFIAGIGKAAVPGAHMVDAIPLMKHIPAWLAGWKQSGMAWHEKENSFFGGLKDDVKRKIVKFASTCLCQ